MRSILQIIAQIHKDFKQIERLSQLPSIGKPKTGRTSNKSKLKQTKSKSNVKYKSSKPIGSKVNKTFRNKSNL